VESICFGCQKSIVSEQGVIHVCPECRAELAEWLRGVLRPVCRTTDDPLLRLYGKPPDGGRMKEEG
jgi:predicted RNA-binding Zn-ribbon protein involved in translation (DUF1610 family)